MWQLKWLVILTFYIVGLNGHGRLMDPPSRNAMWRFGFPNPVNHNDNEVFCGGFKAQFENNQGKCGVCGDNFSEKEPRKHESSGLFGNGIIGKRYTMGQVITVEVEITANHMGYFTLKLCPVNDNMKKVTDECFDKYPLVLASDNTSTSFYIPPGTPSIATLKYDVVLPPGVVCQQCIMQWTYYTGNSWGVCPNGIGKLGCGDQETFRNCADVSIYSATGSFPPGADIQSDEYPHAIYVKDPILGRKALKVKSQVCLPTPAFQKKPHAEDWCKINCLKYPPNCPKSRCTCLTGCRAIGELDGLEGTDVFCLRNCFRYGATHCPKDKCECYSDSKAKEKSSQKLEEEEESFETTTLFGQIF